MKTALTALVIAAAPLSASAKEWVDQACTFMLTTEPGREPPYQLVPTTGAPPVGCSVYAWPLNTDIADMACTDGSRPKMALMPSGQILFGDIHFYPKGHDAIVCD